MPFAPKVAVFLPNWVGDVVMATPALRALRKHFFSACITYVGRPKALQTVAGTTWADKTLADESSMRPGAANLLRCLGGLRANRCELAVLLPNSFRAAAMARLGGIRRLAGYDRDGRGWLLTDKLAPPRDERGRLTPISAIDYYIDLVRLLGVRFPDDGGSSRRMALAVTDTGESAARALLRRAGVEANRPLVMINPGASFGPSKMWASERFAVVADALIERRGAQIIINAAPSERPIAARVAEAMRHRPVINFADYDNTIGLLKSLIRRCSLLITNDTGPRHFAAAFGIGVITLFGSTDPRWAQIDYERERIIRLPVPCSPCQRPMCSQPAGPTYHQCMAAITPEMVLPAADELLDAVAAGGVEVGP